MTIQTPIPDSWVKTKAQVCEQAKEHHKKIGYKYPLYSSYTLTKEGEVQHFYFYNGGEVTESEYRNLEDKRIFASLSEG